MSNLTPKATRGRPTRTPIASRNVLSVKGKEPGYVYRIVNDAGDRISTFQEAGYELVDAADVIVGDKRINSPTAEGTKAQVSVGRGEKAFVMRIKQEWYDEDQKAKADRVTQLESTMKQQASEAGFVGELNLNGPRT